MVPLVYAPVLPLSKPFSVFVEKGEPFLCLLKWGLSIFVFNDEFVCLFLIFSVRLTLRKNPVVRDRLFTAVLVGAFAHGFYLVYPFCFSFSSIMQFDSSAM